jgi:hypothetical protein
LELIQPERRIREALAEAQFVLNITSKIALEKRSKFLRSSVNKQRTINILHFITGSGFISLIALNNPGFIKWLGAAISLVAGVIALMLPKDLGVLEKDLTQDINTLSALAGEIASIQTELIFESNFSNKELVKRITQTIGKCIQLSKKYELDQLVAYSNYNLHNITEKVVFEDTLISGNK